MSQLSSPTTIALLLGAGLALSLLLLASAVRPAHPNLARAAQRWDQRRPTIPSAGQESGSLGNTVGVRLAREATQRGLVTATQRANLALVDRSLEEHLLVKAVTAGAGLAVPSLLALCLGLLGLAPPFAPTMLLAVIGAAIGFVLPDLGLAEKAAARRSDLRRALGCYLDLVAMSLAGGRGVPEALPTAASIGSGWAFELLGHTIATARSTGSTPWEALGALGERTGIPELQDLGSALTLVAHDGAKVRESLTARASTQRRRLLAEAEGDAKKANQTMSMAQIVLAAGFLLFLGYPAVINVLAL
jgi:tight adherence protein C